MILVKPDGWLCGRGGTVVVVAAWMSNGQADDVLEEVLWW